MSLFLIKRGPKPDHHNAPYHPVLVCATKGVAEWECDWTGGRSWMWMQGRDAGPNFGWLLLVWEGLRIDYGHVVRGGTLPDGTTMGFHHPHKKPETWALLDGAIWWSTRPMPAWLREKGVKDAPDDFTRRRIVEDEQFVRDMRGAR